MIIYIIYIHIWFIYLMPIMYINIKYVNFLLWTWIEKLGYFIEISNNGGGRYKINHWLLVRRNLSKKINDFGKISLIYRSMTDFSKKKIEVVNTFAWRQIFSEKSPIFWKTWRYIDGKLENNWQLFENHDFFFKSMFFLFFNLSFIFNVY